MPMYKSKIITIEAIQWNPTGNQPLGLDTLEAFCKRGKNFDGLQVIEAAPAKTYLELKTIDGQNAAHIGDWFVLGTQQEVYICPKAVFAAKYEAV